jgi:hypothetical protein
MSIFYNGGPEKTLKVEYDRSPRYITRKQLYNIPHLHFHVRFRRQGVLRFPFGENEALLLRYSVCQRNGIWPYLLAKIQNLYNKTTLKAKKVVIFC